MRHLNLSCITKFSSKVSNEGIVELTRLISYSFACKLQLNNFPFDLQNVICYLVQNIQKK